MAKPTDSKESPRIRVLLVDDSAIFRLTATHFLQRHDELVVVGAADGSEEAWFQVRDLQPEIVLLGLAMSGMNGLRAIPHLRTILPEVGIIVLSLLDVNAYRQAVLDAGADDFVSKAVLRDNLLPAIRRVAQAKRLGKSR